MGNQKSVITVFTGFRLLTDFVCLYNYEFWLSLCKIVRSSVILLLPLFKYNIFVEKSRGRLLRTLVSGRSWPYDVFKETGTVYNSPASMFAHGFGWVHVAHLFSFMCYAVLCCILFCLRLVSNVMLPVSLDCPFVISPSGFSNVH